jgi:hypothetical protein
MSACDFTYDVLRVHVLALLRRRLQGLFGRSFQLEVRSQIGEGITGPCVLPCQRRSEVASNRPDLSPSLITMTVFTAYGCVTEPQPKSRPPCRKSFSGVGHRRTP